MTHMSLTKWTKLDWPYKSHTHTHRVRTLVFRILRHFLERERETKMFSFANSKLWPIFIQLVWSDLYKDHFQPDYIYWIGQ